MSRADEEEDDDDDRPRPARRREGASKARAPRREAGAPAPKKRKGIYDAIAEQRARRALGLGAATLLTGVALVGIDSSDAGAGLSVIGLVVTIYAIHTFGRLGPDAPRPAPAD